MSDNLTIFDEEYAGVTGIKATGTGNGTLTYIRPQGAKSITQNGTGIDVAAYATADVSVSVSPNLQAKSESYTPSETAQSETVTADQGYDGLSSVSVSVGSIDSNYVGSGVTRRSSSDLSASGATVNVPAGYYSAQASKAVTNGTAGTPTATKGTVSNHSVSVTPSVTNTTGYITGSTKTGTAVSVSASELVSGTKSITSNGTNIDVTNYAAVDVAVPSGTPNLQSKSKSYTPTETAQSETVGYDVGYDGLSSVDVSVGAISSTYVGSGIAQRSSSDLSASGATVTAPAGYYAASATKTVQSGSATPAATISGTSASVSTGTNTLTLSKTVSNTPQVSAGYVSSGTAGNSSVSLTASVTTQAAQTIHPSTSDQSIASGTYTTGAQTIKAVTLENLTADNIKSGVTVKVGDSTDDDCVASVLGTYSGGGGASNIVMGTFTTGSTRNAAQSVTIPYTGSGYPIAAMVYIAGGAYNDGTGGNTTWYNSVDRYDVGIWFMSKARTTTAPTYGTSGADNYGVTAYIYKNSTSSSTQYSRTSTMTANTFTNSSQIAASGATCVRFKGNGKTLTVYVGNKSTTAYGFPPSTELQYIIVYSS